MIRTRLWILSTILFLFGANARAAPPCDVSLQADNSGVGYRMREKGLRCEGTYVAKVSGRVPGKLILVGLTRGQLDLAADRLELRSGLTGQAVFLRGIGIPEKTYYRLDGVIREDGSFIWPLDEVVHRKKLSARDLGLFGFFPTARPDEPVYVPIDVGSDGGTRVRIAGSEVFVNAFWKSGPMQDGRCGPRSADWNQIVDLPTEPDDPLGFDLPDALGTAFCLEVSALPDEGNDWRSGVWKIRRAPR